MWYCHWLNPQSLLNRMFEQGPLLFWKKRFASFHETAKADAVLGYLIAFLVLLATIKLWHLLRLNPKLNMITATLQRAWTDISGFLVVITIMFTAYSITVRRFPHKTQHAICFWGNVELTVMKCPPFRLIWCMGGSCTPIGLCWMLRRRWSACSLVFLTTKRSVLLINDPKLRTGALCSLAGVFVTIFV